MSLEAKTRKSIKDFTQVRNRNVLVTAKRKAFSLCLMDEYGITIDPISGYKINRKRVVLDHIHPYKHWDPCQFYLIRGPLSPASNMFEGVMFSYLRTCGYKIKDFPRLLRDAANGNNSQLFEEVKESAKHLWCEYNYPPARKLLFNLANYWERDYTKTPFGPTYYEAPKDVTYH